MTAIEHKIDRTGWDPGPWDNEPDRIEWRTATGMPGLIVRSRTSGALCGYVAVPPGHPAHGKEYGYVDVSVHGGLTYADKCQAEGGPVCHVPQPGEPDNVWWLGFDCAHAWDQRPGSDAFYRSRGLDPLFEHGASYRTVSYVRAEVERLAAQLAEMVVS